MPAPIPIQQRKEIIRDYLLDGNQSAVAARHGIERHTIGKWIQRKNWDEEVSELQAAITFENRAKARGIIAKAQQATMDRLDQGDPVTLKGGLTIFQPVSAIDAAKIGCYWLDRLRIMEGKPTRISATSEQLQALLDQFKNMGEAYRQGNVLDAVQDSAVIHKQQTLQVSESKALKTK